MSKSIHFFGQSVFGQLISLIERKDVQNAVHATQSDHFCKGFYTWDHLVSMLFCAVGKCNSLRELTAGFLGLKGKAEHLGVSKLPRRSTLSDANRRRNVEVFELIYHSLLKRHLSSISDSRLRKLYGKEVKIFDSTSISLFKSILKAVGKRPASGKSKGGIKVHTLIDADTNVPELVWFSDAASNDQLFWNKITFKKDTIYVFDKGYIDYFQYEKLSKLGAFFVTRLKDTASYNSGLENEIPEHADPGILKDESISLPLRKNGYAVRTLPARRVAYWDNEQQRLFHFVTNLHDMEAEHIAQLYKQRWQIETLFKQFKQNFPLKYFLGDNANAITIQIWCNLIANLLLTVVQENLKRKWSFSNLVSFVRLHLFNYLHLFRFLEEPEKDWEKELLSHQMKLFSG